MESILRGIKRPMSVNGTNVVDISSIIDSLANGETVSKTETCTIDFHSTNTPQLGINTETSQSDPVQTPEIQIDIIDSVVFHVESGTQFKQCRYSSLDIHYS